YECLTGQIPFDGEPLAVAMAHIQQAIPPLPPSVPADVAELVDELTAKDPSARPPSAADVADRADRLRTAPSRPLTAAPGLPVADAEPEPLAGDAEPEPLVGDAGPEPLVAGAEPEPLVAGAEPEPLVAGAAPGPPVAAAKMPPGDTGE